MLYFPLERMFDTVPSNMQLNSQRLACAAINIRLAAYLCTHGSSSVRTCKASVWISDGLSRPTENQPNPRSGFPAVLAVDFSRWRPGPTDAQQTRYLNS